MLQPRNLLPHFEVADLGGKRFQYSSIWQRKNLALVILPDSDPQSRHYADRLMAKVRGLNDDDTEWVLTRGPVEGLPRCGVVVADQWGEIVHLADSSRVQDLPPAEDLIDWVRYLEYRCPECEGEAR